MKFLLCFDWFRFFYLLLLCIIMGIWFCKIMNVWKEEKTVFCSVVVRLCVSLHTQTLDDDSGKNLSEKGRTFYLFTYGCCTCYIRNANNAMHLQVNLRSSFTQLIERNVKNLIALKWNIFSVVSCEFPTTKNLICVVRDEKFSNFYINSGTSSKHMLRYFNTILRICIL